MEELESAKSFFDEKPEKRSQTQTESSTFKEPNSQDCVAGSENSRKLSANDIEDHDRQDTSLFTFEDYDMDQINEFRHDPDHCVDYEKLNRKSDFADISLLDEVFEKALRTKDDLAYEAGGMWNSANRP